jgi:pSer/pThr/pTyr-binding forkhead associated (FHA) protein
VAWIRLPNDEKFMLKNEIVRVGRDQSNDVVLTGDPKVSRSHAEFSLRNEQWLLLDLGSSNGTRVNGRLIEQHPLRDGDRIRVGSAEITFGADGDPNATEAGTLTGTQASDLSEREQQVLALIAQGLTDKDIGERLFITASTVRSHLDRIAEKTGVRRRVELARLAMELGIQRPLH